MIFRLATATTTVIFLLLSIVVSLAGASDSESFTSGTPSQPMTAPPSSSEPIQLPRTSGPIVTDLAITQAVNTCTAQITPALNFVGGVFNASWKRRATGENQPTRQQQLAAQGKYKNLQVANELYYGLTPRADVSINIPVMQNWASDVGSAKQAANFGS